MEVTKSFYEFFEPVMDHEQIQYLMNVADELGFFSAPASLSHHGNHPGGLYEHSLLVGKCLVELTEKLNLKWEYTRSPYIIGMFHDICKCDNYIAVPDTDYEKFEYNNASILTGHGDKSVIMLQQYLELTPEEIACIRWHMGAFDDKANWNHYGHSITVYPNVLWTHTADMMAARIYGI